ncbi:hypothetical protein H0X06_04610 [Candidatus Dependentiae bacterium]|nr:hypothetical protein [Candidatus Dependentiae bacterium]
MIKKLLSLALFLCTAAQEAVAIVPASDTSSCCPAPRPACSPRRETLCKPRVCCPRPYKTRVCRTRRICRKKRVCCPRIRCCRPKPVCCEPVAPPCDAAPCVTGSPATICSQTGGGCVTPDTSSTPYAPQEELAPENEDVFEENELNEDEDMGLV